MNDLVLYVFSILNILTVAPSKPVTFVPFNPQEIPQGYFASPLDIPLTLAGNFCEPRKAHFHTGLDFRTNQMEGLKIYAVADGYISRVNVSGSGYGYALYVRHPNGFVSVYAHLREFNSAITQRLRKEQYAKESFAVDFNLKPGEIPVRKGEVIALSGNTGGSGGPHLHFEIRDTLDNPYNPMHFGFNIKDDIKPLVNALKFYAMDDTMKHRCDGVKIPVALNQGIYKPAQQVIKVNSRKLSFAVNAYDKMNQSEASLGIYNMSVYHQDKLIYQYKADKISFDDKRYVLSHVDYHVFMTEGRKSFHKCHVEPGNNCPVYSDLMNSGVLHLTDNKPQKIQVEITDYSGNISNVQFTVQFEQGTAFFKPKPFTYTTRLDYDHPNEFSTADLQLNWPKGCLYDNVYMSYTKYSSADSSVFSAVHDFKPANALFHTWFPVSIKAEGLPPHLNDKAIIVLKEANGNKASKGGEYVNGWVKGKSRELGQFFIQLDTIPPKITALNVVAGKNMRTAGKLIFKISDNLSGIADFDTYLNDKWVVTEYDAKSNSLTHHLDKSLPSGTHTFKVVVDDDRKNRSVLEVKFTL